MCVRYYIDDSAIPEIGKTFSGIENRLYGKKFCGDINPTNPAPVISAAGGGVQLVESRWGYPGIGGKGVIVNARTETVREKQIFRGGIERGRILIPAAHFYEWDRQKTKYTFHREDGALMFLAGVEDTFGEERRFVILTTGANSSMEKVHDRMPLILDVEQTMDWLLGGADLGSILKHTPVKLGKYTKYEQLTLFT